MTPDSVSCSSNTSVPHQKGISAHTRPHTRLRRGSRVSAGERAALGECFPYAAVGSSGFR